jgi:hypothetical protein
MAFSRMRRARPQQACPTFPVSLALPLHARFGERNPTCLRALLAQLMELITHCSDCAPAHSFQSPFARPLPCVDALPLVLPR